MTSVQTGEPDRTAVTTDVVDHPVAGRERSRGTWRQVVAGVRVLAVLTVVTGLVYPLLLTGIAQLPGLREQARGSLVTSATGQVVGSSLLGQGFLDAAGDPLPQWFQPRPSAAGDGWDGASSGGSNLGPSNPDLVEAIRTRRAAVAARDSVPGHPVDPDRVRPDAVTSSASGLDPHISPAHARQQVRRVASARGLDPTVVAALVQDHLQRRVLGVLGEERVNVLELNLALERLAPTSGA